MFEDDLPAKKKTHDFPRNLDGLSIHELEEYIKALNGEIERVQGDIERKKASQSAADSVFKS